MNTRLTKTLGIAGLALLGLQGSAALAGNNPEVRFSDRGRVISSTPVYEEVNTPRRDCWTERVGESRETVRDRSYGGAIIGGLVGGILGNQIGKGSGRKAAAVLGATTGAIVGNNVDNDGERYVERSYPREVERCRSVDHWTRTVVGYDVVYRYQGREYSTFMARDPGAEVKLQVNLSVAEY
jgi:uncharacterized protein YcfJ